MIVVFHGHKGGTGRSAAVANIAPVLSSAGYRVLVVDFDLEAPGIHRFYGLPDEATRKHGGVIDLVEAYSRALSEGTAFEVALDPAMLLEPRFPKLRTPAGESLRPEQVRERILGSARFGVETPHDAWVKVLPAGRIDADYRRRVATIRWDELYAQPAWRAFFGWFKETLGKLADIVLIDVRAGVTDMGALCLFALADRAVLLTPPTHQGLDGTLETADALARAGAAAASHGLVFVASRVSADADREHLGKWFTDARAKVSEERRLGLWTETKNHPDPQAAAAAMVEDLRLPEVPVHAVGEPLVALRLLERGVQRDPLADAYASLGSRIRTWITESSREAARLQALRTAEEIRVRIEAARKAKELEALPLLWARLAEVLLGEPPDPAGAAGAREAAMNGAALAGALLDHGAEARALVLAGRAELALGEVDGAVSLLERAVAGAEALDPVDLELLGRARYRLGEALSETGKWERAIGALGEAVGAWEGLDERPGNLIAGALLTRAVAERSAGRFAESHESAGRALREAEVAIPLDRSLLARALCGVAVSQPVPYQRAPDAPELVARALALARDLRPLDHGLLGFLHTRAAMVSSGTEAAEHARRGVDLCRHAVPVPHSRLSQALNTLGIRVSEDDGAALFTDAEVVARTRRPVAWNDVVFAACNQISRMNAKEAREKLERLGIEVDRVQPPIAWEARAFLARTAMWLAREETNPKRQGVALARARQMLDSLAPPHEKLEQEYAQLVGTPSVP